MMTFMFVKDTIVCRCSIFIASGKYEFNLAVIVSHADFPLMTLIAGL